MKKQLIKNKIFFIFLVIFLYIACFDVAYSYNGEVKETYPRLANYFQRWLLTETESQELSKWDVVVLDMENQHNNKKRVENIKNNNADTIVLAYITSHEILQKNKCYPGVSNLRCYLHSNINESWYLRDGQGQKIEFWDNSHTLNMANNVSWNVFLPNFMNNKILSNNIWDGVFYDGIWKDVAWLNNGNIDINNDGRIDSTYYINKEWEMGVSKMLETTKQISNGAIVVGNGSSYNKFQPSLNGIMFENFPTPWEGDGTWEASVNKYIRDLQGANKSPQINIINSNTKNTGQMKSYREMRFGLTSALLGNGYFSFDHGDQDHSQVWWYDEYNIDLGKAKSGAYNLLDKNNKNIIPGLWRRDFDKGISLVNSTDQKQTYVFQKEEFEYINGSQDRRVNNGTKTNWVSLESNDGVVLLRVNNEIRNSSFNNGSFVRVFDQNGQQVRNGFFAYKDNYPGNTQILVSDIDNDNSDEILVNGGGHISIYKDGKKEVSFSPYNGAFQGEISFAVSDLNGDGTKEIITGAGRGGGPHVRVFSKDGQPLIGGFFAYDKNFRGGVNVAVMDLNGDGTKEIITGAGRGGGPHVRVFSKDGQPLIGGFFAYDKNFRGGISITTGDVDGDNEKEIITGAGAGGGPQVRIFSKDGKLEKQFLSYDGNARNGIMVMSDDNNNDGIDEIFVNLID